VSYFIGSQATSSTALKTLATISATSPAAPNNLKATWTQSTGFYDATTSGTFYFNVRITCTGNSAKTYFMDDLTLIG